MNLKKKIRKFKKNIDFRIQIFETFNELQLLNYAQFLCIKQLFIPWELIIKMKIIFFIIDNTLIHYR